MIRILFLFTLLFGNLWAIHEFDFVKTLNGKIIKGRELSDCRSDYHGRTALEGNPQLLHYSLKSYFADFYYSFEKFDKVEGKMETLYWSFECKVGSDYCPNGFFKARNGIDCVKDPNDDCPKYSKKVLKENGDYICEWCEYNQKQSEDGLGCVDCPPGYVVDKNGDCVLHCSWHEHLSDDGKSCVSKCKLSEEYKLKTKECLKSCPKGKKINYATFFCVPACPAWQEVNEEDTACVDKCPSGQIFNEEQKRCVPDPCQADKKWNYETKSCEVVQCSQGQRLNEQKECEKFCPLGQVLDENDNCILVEEQECRNQGKCWSPLHSSPFFNNNGRCLDCKLAGDCDYNGKEIYTDFKTCEKCPSGSFPYSSLENGKMGCARQPACDKQGGRIKVINGEEYCVGKWLQAPECAPGVPAKYVGFDGLINTEMLYKCDYSEKDNSISLPLKFIKLTSEESEEQPKEPEQGGSAGDSGSQGGSASQSDSSNSGGSTNQGDSSNAGGTAGGGGSTGGSNSDPKPDTPQDPKPQEPTPPKKPDDTKPKEPKPDDSEPKPQNPDSQTPPPPTPPINNNPPSGGGGSSGGSGSNPKPNGGGGGNPSAPASGDPLTRALNNLEGAVRSNTSQTAGNSNAIGKNTDAINRLIDALNGGLGGGGGNGQGEGQGQGNGQGEGVDLAGLWDAPLVGFEDFNKSTIKGIDDFKNDLSRIVENVKSLGNGSLSLPNHKPATCGVDFEFYGKTIRLELCKFLHQVSNIIYFIVFTFITVAYFRWSLNTIFGTKV